MKHFKLTLNKILSLVLLLLIALNLVFLYNDYFQELRIYKFNIDDVDVQVKNILLIHAKDTIYELDSSVFVVDDENIGRISEMSVDIIESQDLPMRIGVGAVGTFPKDSKFFLDEHQDSSKGVNITENTSIVVWVRYKKDGEQKEYFKDITLADHEVDLADLLKK